MSTLSNTAEHGVGLSPDERNFLFNKHQAALLAKDWGELRDVSAEDVVRLVAIADRLHAEVHSHRQAIDAISKIADTFDPVGLDANIDAYNRIQEQVEKAKQG